MVLDAVIVSAIGKLGIETDNNRLVAIHFLPKDAQIAKPSSKLAAEVEYQLSAFFAKKLSTFDLPLLLPNSPFLHSVLTYMQTISYGKTQTYGEVAKKLKTSPRAIGNACRRNPLPIVIPCHRIVGQHSIGGYSGAVEGPQIEIKKWLLHQESH